MKTTFRKSTIAMAVAAFAASGAVWAQDNGDTNTTTNVTDVEMVKRLSLAKTLTINTVNRGIVIDGDITVDSTSVAVIDDKQYGTGNQGDNFLLQNTATAGDEVMSQASGNIGLNMASGDNNLQDNATAMTALDQTRYNAGLIDSEVFVRQTTENNTTTNQGVENTATIGVSAFVNANGNIGVNVATGNNNLQKNNMAMSVGNGVIAEASVNTEQNVHNNITNNLPLSVSTPGEPGEVSGHLVMQDVTFVATAPAPGVQAGISGTRNTESENGHYGGLSSETGEFHDGISGNYTGNHNGQLQYDTIELVDLGGEITGQVPVWVLDGCGGVCGEETDVKTKNAATLGGQAFMGAGGNIGINMSAGTNNVQSNSLSMALIQAPNQTTTTAR